MEGMKLFQIYEDNLVELEKLLPELCDALYPTLNNPIKVKLRRLKNLLSDIRWNYGPPDEVTIIKCGDEEII
jgi:hypothetical protein